MEYFDIDKSYEELVGRYPNHKPHPVIGIIGNYGDKGSELADGYFRSIECAGGLPLVIPPTENCAQLCSLFDRIDGLLISGGADLNPLFFGEEPMAQLGSVNPERDYMELMAVRLAYDRNLPIFGICRGLQSIVAALGGKIYQDLQACCTDTVVLKHSQDAPRHTSTHSVRTAEDSLLRKIMGEEFAVNSFHHQGVRETGPRLRATAWAADGVVEAVESTELKSIFAVQWHPECYIVKGQRYMIPLFQHFTAEADAYRRAREVHSHILTLDSHCDTPTFFDQDVQIYRRNANTCVDLHKMQEGGLDAVVMAAYLPQGGRSPEEFRQATHRADEILEQIRSRVRGTFGVSLAVSPKGLFLQKGNGRRSVLMGIENGYALGHYLGNVERYRREGIVYITLCHNGDNDICDSACRSNREHGGLSAFGQQVVAEMNRTGMMIDLSHASEETFYQTLDLSTRPVLCSHSSARALCNHPRNLTDDQLRAIAAKEGVVQATFYNDFLCESGEATIADAVRHIMHIIDVAGIDSVGIGSDFDGDGGVRGLATASDFINLTRALMAEGLSEKSLKKIWGGNFIRVMSRVQYNTLQFTEPADVAG